MATYSQVQQALINLGYVTDSNLRYNTKLKAFIPVNGYDSEVFLEFREGCKSKLGNVDELLQVEWLMNDGESCLFLDSDSLNDLDTIPNLFLNEKIILREIFDRVLKEIASIL